MSLWDNAIFGRLDTWFHIYKNVRLSSASVDPVHIKAEEKLHYFGNITELHI